MCLARPESSHNTRTLVQGGQKKGSSFEAGLLKWVNDTLQLFAQQTGSAAAQVSSEAGEDDASLFSFSLLTLTSSPVLFPLPPLLQVNKLDDSSLSDSVVYTQLLSGLSASVNWAFVHRDSNGLTQEQRVDNARYAVSVARKLGCKVYLSADDLADENPKVCPLRACSLLSYVCSRLQGISETLCGEFLPF